MSICYFGSDYHLGHKNLHKYREYTPTIESNYDFIGDNWAATKRDVVYLLGDICFEPEAFKFLQKLSGIKRIVIGNHDWETFSVNMFDVAKTFDKVYGLKSYGSGDNKCWLSHCPIHETEMRKKKFNVHGHIHDESTNRHIAAHPMYVNVNVDVIYPKHNKIMITMDEVYNIHLTKSHHAELLMEKHKIINSTGGN